MPFVEKVHDCVPPIVVTTRVRIGDIWECDHCHRDWQVTALKQSKKLGDFHQQATYQLMHTYNEYAIKYLDWAIQDINQLNTQGE